MITMALLRELSLIMGKRGSQEENNVGYLEWESF